MWSAIRHYASVAFMFMNLAMKRQIEYPSFLVFWAIGIPIQYIAGVWMIGAITERFQALNGWAFPQIAFLYGLSLLSQGLMVVFFIQTWNIEAMVIKGQFDRLLVRPMNVFFQFCVQYFNFIGLLDMLPGIVIFLYGCKLAGFLWTAPNILKLILVLVGATLIRAAAFTFVGSIAFWTKGSRSLVGTMLNLIERTSQYPLTMYPYAIQILFTFLIPFGFISFYPACEFLGMGGGLEIPLGFSLLTPLVGLLMSLLALGMFNAGMKKYESSGS